ncbi:hypothetical protein QL112_012115 [Xenorhabdus griffiniae]|uniref:N-acetyltransferase n=1 Tax=Xenorhabdus griffiniae TaxID=351672 RepID=A0ABY9XDL5_9GAMM|nr:hypothetical protein [Xenorhabdus griffiniae]WMV70946.1 hypothetical protein QL128_12110 [Xenorhabdus griffiniae]WNH00622.1 hypothetical protein QL112_012115 [Xenorhabdus griffiniae]
MDNLRYLPFSEININDGFFSSLKSDYEHGFVAWFNKKSSNHSERAYVLFNESKEIDGFMYLKIENGIIDDVTPSIPAGKHLKIGTFKFNPKGTLRGQRFLKKIFDNALSYRVDNVYVTVFKKHDYLIRLFKLYGFNEFAIKETKNGKEVVLLKCMNGICSTGNAGRDLTFLARLLRLNKDQNMTFYSYFSH